MSFGNNGLQFDANQPLARYLQFVHGQPPMRPNVQYLPTMLNQAYPHIVTYTIDAVQSDATLNPGRTYFYNMITNNGWSNNQFTALLDFVIRLVEIQIRTNQAGDMDTTIKRCADRAVELSVGYTVVQTPGLKQMVNDVSVQQTIMRVAQDYEATHREINQFYNNSNNNNNNNGNWNSGNNNNNNNGSWSLAGGSGNRNSNWNSGNSNNQNPLSAGLTGGGNTINANSTQQATTGRWNEERQRNAQTQQQPAAQAQAQAPLQTVLRAGALVDSTEIGWIPSNEFPYVPAFNPQVVELKYKVIQAASNAAGKSIPAIFKPITVLKDPTVSTMDWREHIPGLNTTPYEPLALNMAEENKKNVDTSSVQRLGTPPPIVVYSDLDAVHVGAEDSIGFSALDISLPMMALDNPKQVTVAMTYGKIYETMVCSRDAHAFLVALFKQPTVIEMARYLGRQAEIVSGETQIQGAVGALPQDLTSVRLLNAIDRRLTQALNRLMALTLGQYMRVRSFLESVGEVDAAFAEKGPVLKGAWDRLAIQYMRRVLMLTDPAWSIETATADIKANSFRAEKRELGKDMFVSHLCEDNIYASVGLMSSQLQAQFPNKKISVALYEAETPVLFGIAREIFKFEEQLSAGGKKPLISRRLLKTLDDVVFCVTASPFQNDYYLIHQSDGFV